ncbi:MAG: NAD(P)H-binding protein [Leptospiraceae bacterium]
MRVAVTGATGFVGRSFIQQFGKEFSLRGLGRSGTPPAWLPEGTQWKSADLYSLLDAEQALKNCDVAIYLIHSMVPSARLNQGSFEDTDLILADNFARAARKAGVKRIIYLGGIMPDIAEEELSVHLRSRKEVETVLGSTGIPVIAIRAALVLGPGGSSFEMMRKLVQRLPVMVCPSWTSSLSNPVYVQDLLNLIHALVNEPGKKSATINAPGPDRLSYIDLMGKTAKALGKKRYFLPVSFYSPRLSLLWIELITGSSSELVSPLVESLKHDMVADAPAKYKRLLRTRIDEALMKSSAASTESSSKPGGPARTATLVPARKIKNASRNESLVRSVQRLPLPDQKNAIYLAELYPIWLQSKLRPFLKIKRNPDSGVVGFYVLGLKLLELTLSQERSDPTRQLYYVTGGLLAASNSRGRLEFRTIPSLNCALSAVHSFQPALPWYIYKFTQAPVHLWVMNAFARFLATYSNPVP